MTKSGYISSVGLSEVGGMFQGMDMMKLKQYHQKQTYNYHKYNKKHLKY